MIRHLNETDLTEILSVWLNTNLQAHSFIPAEYWKENYDIVKQMRELPNEDPVNHI